MDELAFPFYLHEEEFNDWDILTKVNEDLTYLSITYDRVLGIFSLYLGTEFDLDEGLILDNIDQPSRKALYLKALEAVEEMVNIAR